MEIVALESKYEWNYLIGKINETFDPEYDKTFIDTCKVSRAETSIKNFIVF